MPSRLICLHGHFYQPPRENPWIEEIEVQDSAEPFHDWNERIAAECYGPNGAARIKNASDRIVDIVNNYLHLSFNFGPTLLAWLERERPDVYRQVVDADAKSVQRRGHGNALAQAYNHAILPLCSERDRRSQIRWGIADFRHRFRRDPEGFWLPETAADTATLADLSGEGIRFTILSPHQAVRVRPPGGDWLDASGARFDPTRPYRVKAGERDIAVFFYDAQIASEFAFGDALSSADALVARLEAGYDPGRAHDELLTVAFDGETLGHHKKGGDEVLAAALRRLEGRGDLKVVNFGQALDRLSLEWEAEIAEPSSWSCAHGVERWRSDCGCQTSGQPGWHQRWRAPLREALDAIRDRLAEIFEREAAHLMRDPWGARDRFVALVLDPERKEAAPFLRNEAGRSLDPAERLSALRLLEMQRQAMLMYTSCGWFFSEISGLETIQVLKYAARAIQLAREAAGVDLEPELVVALARAPSNIPEMRDGGRVYDLLVRPSVASLEKVGAHIAIASFVRDAPEDGRVFGYRYRVESRRTARSGPVALALGRLRLERVATGSSLEALSCVLHFGASDFRCGLAPYSTEWHLEVEQALFPRLAQLSLAQLIREVDRFFTGRDYTLRDLFLDERRRVAGVLLAETIRRYEDDYLQIFEDNLRLMESLSEIDSPIPGPLRVAADVSLTRKMLEATEAIGRGGVSLEQAEAELGATIEMARRLGAHLHLAAIRRDVEALIRSRVSDLLAGEDPSIRAQELIRIIELARRMGLGLDLWDAQNRLWDWARSSLVTLDRETAARLASNLWLDEETFLARAEYAPRSGAGA